MKAEVNVLATRLSAVEDKQNNQADDLTAVSARVNTLEESSKKQLGREAELQEKIADSVFAEQKERENRRDNIVVHSLEEAPVDVVTADARREADVMRMQELFHTIGSGVDAKKEIRFLTRLGGKDAVKPRPLLVGFTNSRTKATVMENTSKLKEMEEPWSNVNVIHNITVRQRKEEQRMFADAKAKNEALGNDELVNFQWTVVGRRGERSLVKVKKKLNAEPNLSTPYQQRRSPRNAEY